MFKPCNNKIIRQSGIYYLTLPHKEKQKVCKFFVEPESDPALLGKPDIQTLGVITINCETIGRQLASDDNADKRRRKCQYERVVQTGGRKPESCQNQRHDFDVQHYAVQTMLLSQALFLVQ